MVHVPADGRLCGFWMEPRADFLPSMCCLACCWLDWTGRTPFDRLRPLLVEARGQVARMLLTAWDQALTIALQRADGPTALTRELVSKRDADLCAGGHCLGR